MKTIAAILFVLSFPFESLAASSCISTAFRVMNFCDSRNLCARVTSNSCFSRAFQVQKLEDAANTCRGVMSDACFNKALEALTLEKAASLCVGVSSNDCFTTAFNRFYNLEDSAKVCRDFVTTAPPPIPDDPCTTNPH